MLRTAYLLKGVASPAIAPTMAQLAEMSGDSRVGAPALGVVGQGLDYDRGILVRLQDRVLVAGVAIGRDPPV